MVGRSSSKSLQHKSTNILCITLIFIYNISYRNKSYSLWISYIVYIYMYIHNMYNWSQRLANSSLTTFRPPNCHMFASCSFKKYWMKSFFSQLSEDFPMAFDWALLIDKQYLVDRIPYGLWYWDVPGSKLPMLRMVIRPWIGSLNGYISPPIGLRFPSPMEIMGV